MAKQDEKSGVSQPARVLYRLLADAASRTVVGATDRSAMDLVERASPGDRAAFSPKGRLNRAAVGRAWKELVDGGYVRGRRFKRTAAPLAGAADTTPQGRAGATAAPAASAKPAARATGSAKRRPTATKPATRPAPKAKTVAKTTTAPRSSGRRPAARARATSSGAGGRVQAAERELTAWDQKIAKLERDLAAAQAKRASLATRLGEIERLLGELA